MANLPPPRQLVASLITSLTSNSPPDQQQTTANPLKDASPETSKALLTLHVLFPNELLPAFDLLDRGLVTRFATLSPVRPQDTEGRRETAAYYVRSAQPQTRHHSATTSYEVRLDGWTCSCPAFAFAAFPAEVAAVKEATAESNISPSWIFGGLTLGGDMPVCKHLLACVLVERCAMFGHFAVEQMVSVEELAGWAAGWGD